LIHCLPCSVGAGASHGKPASNATSLLLVDDPMLMGRSGSELEHHYA